MGFQTPLSKRMDQDLLGDTSPTSHGTIVAIKAAGKYFGASKKSIIVPVKMAYLEMGLDSYDILEAL